MVVKGEDDVDYQKMIYVLDILRQLDITKVGLATEGVAGPRAIHRRGCRSCVPSGAACVRADSVSNT